MRKETDITLLRSPFVHGSVPGWLITVLVLLALSPVEAAITFRSASQNGIDTVPPGAITHVGTGTSAAITGCGDINPSIPGGSAGDLLIAQAIAKETDGGNDVTMSGWNLYYSDADASGGDDNELQIYIFWRIATGGDPNTVTQSGGFCSSFGAQISRFSGVDTASPFETGSPGVVFQDSGDLDTGTITTTSATAMLLVGGFVSDDRNVAEGGGWSESYDFDYNDGGSEPDFGLSLHYQAQTTAGNKSISNWDLSGGGNDENFGVIYALTPATSTAGLTINVPAGTTTDDVMVAAISVRPSTIAITPPAGWTSLNRVDQTGGNSNAQEIFYRLADGSEPGSYTWTFSGSIGGAAGGISTYSGVDTGNPVDAFGGNVTPDGTTHTANSINTTVADTMVVSSHSFSSAETWTPPAGMTERVDVPSIAAPQAGGISLEMNDVTQSAAGATGNKSATAAGNADTGVAQMVAFTPAATSSACDFNSGLAGGIPGDYYNNMTLTDPPAGSRVDGPIDFNWGTGSPGVAGVGTDQFSVRWEGSLRVTSTDTYRFQTESDDGVRLWIDGNLVIDNWTDHAPTTNTSANVALTAGQLYDVRLEYYENGGGAVIRLRWGRASGGFSYSPIPAGPEPSYGEGLYYCDAVPVPEPQAEYRMEEENWDGTTDEVIDETGNGYDGTAQNGADTDDADPAIAGDPGTCRYGEFDGNNDYIEVSGLSGLLNGTASLAFWINTTQAGNDTGWQAPGVTGVEEAGGADDIFWGWIDASGNIGISVANDYAADQKSVTEINDGAWHHVVLTRDATTGDTKIYVDGTLETSGNTGSGTIGNSYTSIGRIEDTGGTPEYFDGDLDEVRIYDTILTDDQVTAVYNDTHACPVFGNQECAADYSIYGADQLNVSNNVTVNGNNVTGSGNAIDPDTGQVYVDSPPLPGLTPSGFPSFSGPNRSIPPPGNSPVPAGDYGTIQVNNNQTALFDTGNGNDFRIQQLQTGNNVTLNLEAGTYFINQLQLGNGAELNVVGGGTVELYIGSQLQGSNGSLFNSGGNPGDLLVRVYDGGQLQLDNVAEFTGSVYAPGSNTQIQLSNGVMFYGGIFSGGQVDLSNNVSITYDAAAEQAGREIAGCTPAGPDHYAIDHDGNGVTCVADEITITAHDTGHSPLDPGTVTIDLSTTTGRGDWTAVVSGSGSLNNSTQGDGAATYTFPGGESSVTLAFNYTNIPSGNSESFFFDVTDGTATDLGDGDPEDPQMTFARTGFRFFNETDGNSTIPTQIAGKPSDVAPDAKAITLQAIRSSDEDPSVCEPAFPDGANRPIELAAECRNPQTCAGNQVNINGNAVATNADDAAADTGSYTPVTLSFGPQSTVPLTLEYFDAGLIQLHARYNIPLEDGTPSGDFMLGGSNAFVVRPFGFHVDVAGNPGATDANGTVFVAAGEDVDVTVTAVVWQPADDGDNDGVADGHGAADTDAGNNADLGNNAATPNFGQETAPEIVLLSPRLDQPSGGNTGALTGGTGLTGFSSGSASSTIQYTEVGIIEVRAEVTDYLGGGDDAAGMSGYVGRFIPFDFDVTRNSPEFGTACSAGANGYTYIGEPFTYNIAPVLTVTARSASGATTQNYTGAFLKLTEAKLDADGDKSYEPANLDTSLVPVTDPTVQDQGGGIATLTFSDGGGLAFFRNAPEAPFDAEISLSINVIDEDDVVYGDGAGNSLNPAQIPDSGSISFDDSPEQRWGRLVIINAGGSELLDVDVPVRAEYYDGTGFIPNSDDGCTVIEDLDGDVLLSNPETAGGTPQAGDSVMTVGGGTTQITSGPPAIASGEEDIIFSAPGEGNTGFVDIEINLDVDAGSGGSDDPWLQYDWDDDGSFDNNPGGRASFGIYRGSDELIYTREPWN